MLKRDEIYDESVKSIEIICPQCRTKKLVKIPKKLIEESSTLVTISFPSKFICEHGFQAFIDKQFNLRGYQSADFEITQMEIYETGTKLVDDIINYEMSRIIKKAILALRAGKQIQSILGGALFNQKGQILYTSLPDDVFLNLINQFEIKRLGHDIKFKEMIFVLEDDKVIVAKLFKTERYNLIMVVFFPAVHNLMKIMNFFNEISENFFNIEG